MIRGRASDKSADAIEQHHRAAAEPAKIKFELRWMLVPLFCTMTGYTDKAVRRKIEDGVWLQGTHYRKAPDGRITMDLQAYYIWVESG